jgi:hypothetical protein
MGNYKLKNKIMQNKKLYRISFIVAAIIAALLIVYVLSSIGGKSKGPLENILHSAEKQVENFENGLIIEDRVAKRKEKLHWFEAYKKDINLLKNPKKILFGASDNSKKESFETIINLEDSLQTTFPIIHIYNAWGSKPSEKFPTLSVKTIIGMGSTPMITWEPWLGDFDSEEYKGIPLIEKRDKGCLNAISKGTYDKYIRTWAQEAKKIGEPIFIRFAHEMNDPYRYPWGPQNNKPEDFRMAWRHVYHVFQEEGVDNVVWVWAPHPSYKYFDVFYPGDDYVDYVGLGVLNFGTAVSWSKWWEFKDLFGKDYPALSKFNKPIMLAEFGSLNVGGNRAQWFADALRDMPEKYPLIKSILYFHYPADKTLTNKKVSWYFVEDQDVLDSIKSNVAKWEE